MRADTLRWSHLGRLQISRLLSPPILGRSGRRLLCSVALVVVVSLAGLAALKAGGELPLRGLALAGELASAFVELVTAVPDDLCDADGSGLPTPGARAEASRSADLRPGGFPCDR